MPSTVLPMARQQDTSANIRAEIARAKKSQRGVALAAGISRGRWAARMADSTTWRIEELQKVALALDVPVADLLGDEVSR